jgi:integrase/recombinase XerD
MSANVCQEFFGGLLMKEAISEHGGTMIAQFIRVLSTREALSPKTLKEYASDLKHFIGWFEAAGPSGKVTAVFQIEDVATPTLVRYRNAMQETMELKPSTINRRLVTLKRFFDWAVSEAKVSLDPSKPVKLVPEEKTNPRQMTEGEEAALLAATKEQGSLRDQTLVFVMLHTGLRPMEVCNLTPGDIHFGGNSLIVRTGMRNKSREVPLSAECRAVLEHYLAQPQSESIYLFSSEKTGGRLTERALRHLVQKYMRAAHIEGLRAQDLRHRFGYTMAASLPLQRLAQIMGHDRLNSTMIYVKGDLGKAVE